jgi:hypothetical protein
MNQIVPVNSKEFFWVYEFLNLFKGMVKTVIFSVGCLKKDGTFHDVKAIDAIHWNGLKMTASLHKETGLIIVHQFS